MPHSKNKQIFFNGHKQYGTLSCSCGKVMGLPMEYLSAQEWSLKIKLHMKVCNNPPKGFKVKNPKVKSMGPLGPQRSPGSCGPITLKKALQYSSDRNKKVYE